MNKNQFGFRQGHSTINAITKFTYDTLQALDSGHDNLSVFLDLSKAFDTINHQLLCRKIISISNVTYNHPTSSLFKSLAIPRLNDILLGKFMFQNSKNGLPPPLQTLFTPNTNVHTYFTRHRDNPHIEHRSSYIISKTFVHKGPKLWFELPTYIKEVNNKKLFTKKLKKLYIDDY